MRLVEAEIRTLPQQQFGYSTGQFESTKRSLGGLPAPRRQNADRMAPSPDTPQPGGLRELRAQRFTMSYPSNWQVYGDQNASAFTIAPREGVLQDNQGNTQIGHGVMANWYFPQTRGLQEGTRELLGRLQSSNPTMQVSGRQSRVRVGGSEGLMTMMQSGSPYGGTEIDYLLTVNRPEGLFYLVFVAPERDFNALRPTFDEMIRSIRFQ
jgi:hypothetical protein